MSVNLYRLMRMGLFCTGQCRSVYVKTKGGYFVRAIPHEVFSVHANLDGGYSLQDNTNALFCTILYCPMLMNVNQYRLMYMGDNLYKSMQMEAILYWSMQMEFILYRLMQMGAILYRCIQTGAILYWMINRGLSVLANSNSSCADLCMGGLFYPGVLSKSLYCTGTCK